jgi:delta8-fatty-acid desaturase
MSDLYTVNMGNWEIGKEKADEIAKDFDHLRLRVRKLGLLDGSHLFYIRKFTECVSLIALALCLQWQQSYVISALVMGLAWQQLGWVLHEFCHHQATKV